MINVNRVLGGASGVGGCWLGGRIGRLGVGCPILGFASGGSFATSRWRLGRDRRLG